MGNARQIAIILKRDGYDISTINASVMALEEDLGYSEEEAISIADMVVREARTL